jgi:iron-only hydrogenase group A
VEESAELVHRVKNGGKLPMITSCCPAWISFVEHHYPDLLEYPSSCKSPHEIFGVLAKTYFAEKKGIDPSKIICVSIMPCLSKKYEAKREELQNGGIANVDYVLTTRELGHMIKEAGIAFDFLPDEQFDSLMGESSGAADSFGTTGGVLEAVLRTFYEDVANKKLDKLEFEALRGIEGAVIKEATIDLNGTKVKVAVAHELKNARKLLDDMRAGKSEYHVIEIMACPGGCINGGGQPYHKSNEAILNKRREALYNEDKNKTVRRAHENTELKTLYDDFLKKPNSEKAHDLLHTKYVKRTM